MRTPIIGVTGHFDDRKPDSMFIKYFSNYIHAVRNAGGITYLIPITSDKKELARSLEMIDGLMLSGGGGLPKEIKSMESLPNLRDINPVRYDFERKLLLKAKKMGIPILGICRGHQMITEVFGGTLRNLSKEEVKDHYLSTPGTRPVHQVTLNKRSRIHRVLKREKMMIKSFHRQVTENVPPGFMSSFYSEEGLIEGIEHKKLPIIGLQFHPEKHIQEKNNKRIIVYFVDLCRRYSWLRKFWNKLIL